VGALTPARGRAPARAAPGFTLVEILVSITLLSVASVSLGTLLFRAARLANATSSASYQTATLAGTAARYDALPFDSLAAGTTCVTVTTQPFPYTRCTTVNNVSSKVKTVVIVVSPSGNSLMRPDTTLLTRTISGNGNPLKTTP
jgi:prepilin-type N-terminal cleavage/methylation domain-containing protein